MLLLQVQSTDSGTYICTATAGQFVVSDRTQLTVDPAPGPAPRVVISPQYRQARAGEAVNFVCEAEGRPAPALSWSRPGGRQLGRGVSVRGDTLVIAAARSEHEGRYVCRATNSAGSGEAETILRVTEAGAGVSLATEEVVAEAGGAVTLTCASQNPGSWRLEWSRAGGGGLAPGAQQQAGVLSLPRVTARDEGVYICTARGPAGEHQQLRARVLVRGGPGAAPSVLITPEQLTVGQGETAELVCRATGQVTNQR